MANHRVLREGRREDSARWRSTILALPHLKHSFVCSHVHTCPLRPILGNCYFLGYFSGFPYNSHLNSFRFSLFQSATEAFSVSSKSEDRFLEPWVSQDFVQSCYFSTKTRVPHQSFSWFRVKISPLCHFPIKTRVPLKFPIVSVTPWLSLLAHVGSHCQALSTVMSSAGFELWPCFQLQTLTLKSHYFLIILCVFAYVHICK